jgi:hypothetical protein
MNHRLNNYFDIRELVCPHVYDKFREYAWNFFDPRLLDTLLVIREKIGKPIYVNNWDMGGNFSQRGLRSNLSPIVKEKTSLEKLYISAHCQGMGVDFNVVGMSVADVHKWLKENQILLPYPIRLEDIESAPTWIHLDVRSDGMHSITYFKA